VIGDNMKTLIAIIALTITQNAVADSLKCVAIGEYWEKQVLEAAKDRKDHPTAKWFARCINLYFKESCEVRNGELKGGVMSLAILKEATAYCTDELKKQTTTTPSK
jgi:hypothetical protein